MPTKHTVSIDSLTHEVRIFSKNGVDAAVTVVSRKPGLAYIHFVNQDKRLDDWVAEDKLRMPTEEELKRVEGLMRPRKRKRTNEGEAEEETGGEIVMSEQAYDLEQHKKITAQRNINYVIFRKWKIKTWYFSPYPLEEDGDEPLSNDTNVATREMPTVVRHGHRSHSRTIDLFVGGYKPNGANEVDTLWVCNYCFKYMTDAGPWELHMRRCDRKHPPGTKVYQRGAHTIWEVDGAQEKLYCQNLSLFGKLFLDVKTLFFDCDNFLFYVVTDADSQRDHVYGFFSKEKVSYDDYNLACIVILPPYQRQGFGMLLIEFSYELSRLEGKRGTPERPLSDLGLRSYLAYWAATIIRYLRRLLSVLPPEQSIRVINGETQEDGTLSAISEPPPSPEQLTRKKKAKGWAGEVDGMAVAPLAYMDDPLYKNRRIEQNAMPDGSAVSHVVVNCTLDDIARATNLRVEDAAFALNEIGLLGKTNQDGEFVITRERVEKIALERRVKMPCIELSRVTIET